jgi:hypothetical protein
LDKSVLQIKTKIFSYHTADSKPVKREVNGTVILSPLVFPAQFLATRVRLGNCDKFYFTFKFEVRIFEV